MDAENAPTLGCPVPSLLISFRQSVHKAGGETASSKEHHFHCQLDRGLMPCLGRSGGKGWKALVSRACGLLCWLKSGAWWA